MFVTKARTTLQPVSTKCGFTLIELSVYCWWLAGRSLWVCLEGRGPGLELFVCKYIMCWSMCQTGQYSETLLWLYTVQTEERGITSGVTHNLINNHEAWCILTLTVPVTTIDALWHFETGQWQHSARGWGSRVGEVRAGTTSPMPEHKGLSYSSCQEIHSRQ